MLTFDTAVEAFAHAQAEGVALGDEVADAAQATATSVVARDAASRSRSRYSIARAGSCRPPRPELRAVSCAEASLIPAL